MPDVPTGAENEMASVPPGRAEFEPRGWRRAANNMFGVGLNRRLLNRLTSVSELTAARAAREADREGESDIANAKLAVNTQIRDDLNSEYQNSLGRTRGAREVSGKVIGHVKQAANTAESRNEHLVTIGICLAGFFVENAAHVTGVAYRTNQYRYRKGNRAENSAKKVEAATVRDESSTNQKIIRNKKLDRSSPYWPQPIA